MISPARRWQNKDKVVGHSRTHTVHTSFLAVGSAARAGLSMVPFSGCYGTSLDFSLRKLFPLTNYTIATYPQDTSAYAECRSSLHGL